MDYPKIRDIVDRRVKQHEREFHTGKGGFVPPTVEQVRQYAKERGYTIDVQKFVDFYQAKGWMVGKTKMKDWQAAVRGAIKDGWVSPKKIVAERDYESDQKEKYRKQYGNWVKQAKRTELEQLRKSGQNQYLWFLIDELRPEIWQEMSRKAGLKP